MAMTIKPIFALNLMSCTVPVDNSTRTSGIPKPIFNQDDFDMKPFSMEYDTLKKRRLSINLPIYKQDYEDMVFQNTRTPVKVRRIQNRNQYHRRNHNIKQPGRTNCTQRLF